MKRILVRAGLLALGLLLVPRVRDELHWRVATVQGDEESVHRYLRAWPYGAHVGAAVARLEDVASAASQRRDTVRTYEAFLEASWSDRFVPAARARVSALRSDDAPLERAMAEDTSAALEAFFEDFPGHLREEEARSRPALLRHGEPIGELLARGDVAVTWRGIGIDQVGVTVQNQRALARIRVGGLARPSRKVLRPEGLDLTGRESTASTCGRSRRFSLRDLAERAQCWALQHGIRPVPNQSDAPLVVGIPAGSDLVAERSTVQSMVVTRPRTVRVPAGRSAGSAVACAKRGRAGRGPTTASPSPSPPRGSWRSSRRSSRRRCRPSPRFRPRSGSSPTTPPTGSSGSCSRARRGASAWRRSWGPCDCARRRASISRASASGESG